MGHRNMSDSSRSPSPSSGSVQSHDLSSETLQVSDPCQGLIHGSRSSLYTEESTCGTPETKAFLSRFWVLFWFSIIALDQSVQWNSWGPISESVLAAYPDWKPSTIAMMANWGTITVLVFIVPACWVNQHFGMRTGTLMCAGLIALGTALRCLPVSDYVFTILCHFCAICVGTAGTIMASPAMIAAIWFPPNERTTATAVSQTSNHFGSLVAYLQPMLVRAPGGNVTQSDIREDITRLMYIDGIIAAVIFFTVLLYFPNKPSIPPSITSHVERLEFVLSLKKLIMDKSMWMIAISFAVSSGVPGIWMGVMNFSLLSMGIHEDEAMLVGIVAVTASVVSPLITAKITDSIYGFVRVSIMLLLVGATASFYWFYLLSSHTIAIQKWEVYFSTSLGLMCIYGSQPLFYELAVEIAYPCPEVVVGGFLTVISNIVGLVFLLIFFVPNIGYQWVSYVLLCSSSLTLIPLLLLEESYGRSSIDRAELEEQPSLDSEPQVSE